MFKSAALTAALLLLLAPAVLHAHDIPNAVTVHAFFKPDGSRAQLLLRVPLESMRDIDYPKRGEYMELSRIQPWIEDAANLWLTDIELYEEQTKLPRGVLTEARISLPSDKSFGSFDEALAHVTGPRLPPELDIHWEQSLLDVLFEFPIQSDQSRFSVRPRFERLGIQVVTMLRYVLPDGTVRAFDLHGDPDVVRLDPRWHQAALTFLELGFHHILDGIDHLLFLLCLVIPFRKVRPLILIVTSFTLAHSVSLIAAAYNMAPDALWFPPLVETLIAASILYMALENIVGSQVHRRLAITFAFGLIHGFGFSFALQETLQFAGAHLLTSLLAFNAGVELGQILVLLLLVPLLDLALRYVVAERIGTIIISAIVAHTGIHWVTERGAILLRFPLPEINAASVASAMRWGMVLVAVAGLLWLVSTTWRRHEEDRRNSTTIPGPFV